MPDYRIEVSPNNRAGCSDGVCKKAAAKCLKGSLRFGTWTKIMDHESFKWKHWHVDPFSSLRHNPLPQSPRFTVIPARNGHANVICSRGCVSGEVIKHVQEVCEKNGQFDFDAFDGYDELIDHPDLQRKIREAIEQGHIADEDFNGDPWMNKLGQRGIRGKKPKGWDDGEDEDEEEAPAKGKKRSRKAADDEEEEKPKAKRTKKAAVKAEVKDEDEEEEKPKPKAKRGKAAVKKEESDADEEAPKPKRGARKSAVKKEESGAEEEAPKPKRGARKSAVKKEESDAEDVKVEAPKVKDEEVSEEEAPKPKRGTRKSAVKKEEPDAEEAAEKTLKPKRGPAKKAKVEESEEGTSAAEPASEMTPKSEEEEEEKPALKTAKAAPKGRKKAAPGAEAERPKSTRASRSRK
ncbi:hypothetical protein BDP55DRAFT_18683 [Colletotrichum godetiae]|uniref:PARP-type domain-containing protein n=1 Tax=Colletotrichum godetiae TaxID=1209918 RepID=A0AAJ0F5E6_9PEZI|nr:uncharacterized protein BDP55DRAFT_18683 [Colletotrichum godetiae]KAK1701373.1 hypothetical protein BDP55DRAFT_18683 [Colletotrichum godetiae]